MEISDGVVRVRPATVEYAEQIAGAVQESLERLAPWMPWATPDYDRTVVETWVHDTAEKGEHPFVVFDGDDTVIGTCGLNRIDAVNKTVNLGYWLRTGCTGKGYATRAAALIARHAHESLDFHRVEIFASVRNFASCAVAERVGARHEGVLRDRILLRGEWHDANMYSLLPGEVRSP